MSKSDYIRANEDAFAAQLMTFKTNIGSYATVLGLTPAEINGQAADALYFGYVLAVRQLMQNAAQQWTAWKDLLRGGGPLPNTGTPVAPGLPASVTAVAPGIELRFRSLVKQIKAHAKYNTAIGEALGIEGAQQMGPDWTVLQPEISAKRTGDQVLVGWGWGGHRASLDMIELQVDRSDGKGFLLLAYDTTPGYTDTTPLPSTLTQWTYKAIYRKGDQRVGLWSKEVSITVGG